MKTKTQSILILLFTFTITNTFGQIPNNGFENWGTYNGFDNPTGWTGIIGTGDNGYSIQKNSDNYPSGTGLWSILIKTDTLYYFGFAKTDRLHYVAPGFPITGKPTGLTGYYKFLPQNGDTMVISVVLWQSGAIVASATFSNTATISSWTSFNVLIPPYTTADSASIFLSSCSFPGGVPDPQGNSALYIDNLNFDNLIIGISEVNETNRIYIYPNPFSSSTALQTDEVFKNATLTVYNVYGQRVKQIDNLYGQTIIFHRDNLPSGIYFLCLTDVNKSLSIDKLVITD